MPNLRTYRESYYSNTGKLSDNARTLALSAIAVIWLFKTTSNSGEIVLPPNLYWAIFWVFGALLCDFVQYLYAGIAWGAFSRNLEKSGVGLDDPFDAPNWINWPTLLFFYGKIVLLGTAYALIVHFLFGKLTM